MAPRLPEDPAGDAAPAAGSMLDGVAGAHLVVGWREFIDFPDWHIRGVIAKFDTGARTGALDVSELVELPGDRVRFAVRLKRRGGRAARHIEADISRRTRVRSAFGHAHERLFIETTVRIGPVTRRVELGLVCRKRMLCRVLIGRMALDGQFLVDSGQRYLLGRPERSDSSAARRERRSDVARHGPGSQKDVK